jgi:YrbI family 3-deoxy-D-manno-octulosonate 8-phosphate phosphatase
MKELSSSSDIDLVEHLKTIKLIVFDFDGVFTDNTVIVDQNGMESVRCSRSDGLGLDKLRRLQINHCILSTEPNPVVLQRAEKLQIQCRNDCKDKKKELIQMMQELKISFDQVAFVGNDINDEACLDCVGLPIVVKDAHPEVMKCGRYVTKTKGGNGAVREICDLFEKAYETSNHNRQAL